MSYWVKVMGLDRIIYFNLEAPLDTRIIFLQHCMTLSMAQVQVY